MAVAEAPGKVENETGEPLKGPTGQLFDEIIEKAGLPRHNWYLTNVVKYQPPFNDFTKLHLINVDLAESIRKLWDEEILRIKPNVILCMGNQALEAVTGLTGITTYRGSILSSKDGQFKVVPTIHPAALFPKAGSDSAPYPWVYKKIIEHDIQRAIDESSSPEFNLPVRSHDIAHNSLEVFRFFDEYSKLERPSCDI